MRVICALFVRWSGVLSTRLREHDSVASVWRLGSRQRNRVSAGPHFLSYLSRPVAFAALRLKSGGLLIVTHNQEDFSSHVAACANFAMSIQQKNIEEKEKPKEREEKNTIPRRRTRPFPMTDHRRVWNVYVCSELLCRVMFCRLHQRRSIKTCRSRAFVWV